MVSEHLQVLLFIDTTSEQHCVHIYLNSSSLWVYKLLKLIWAFEPLDWRSGISCVKTGDVLVQAGEVLYHVCPRLFFSFGCCCFICGGLVMCLLGDTDILIIKLLTTSYKAHPFVPCCVMQGLELCTLASCCFCEVLSIWGTGRFLLFWLIHESSNPSHCDARLHAGYYFQIPESR